MSDNRNMDDEVMDWIEKGIIWGLFISVITGTIYIPTMVVILIVVTFENLIKFITGIM